MLLKAIDYSGNIHASVHSLVYGTCVTSRKLSCKYVCIVYSVPVVHRTCVSAKSKFPLPNPGTAFFHFPCVNQIDFIGPEQSGLIMMSSAVPLCISALHPCRTLTTFRRPRLTGRAVYRARQMQTTLGNTLRLSGSLETNQLPRNVPRY